MSDKSLDKAFPQWLDAYPNQSSLDYFGFRWQRQTLRRYLLLGGASNNFKTAKTLLFFPAIAVAFRREIKIDLNAKLNVEQSELWKNWFQRAYFLFVIFQTIKFNARLDQGFTGGKEILKSFPKFLTNTDESLNIDDHLHAFFGNGSRPFGYYAQYWSGPMRYYDAVIDIENCAVGNYGHRAYDVASKKSSWTLLLRTLQTGNIIKLNFDKLTESLAHNSYDDAEHNLVQEMILDREIHHAETSSHYQSSYKQFCNILNTHPLPIIDDGWLNESLIAKYLYRTLTNLPVYNEQESMWRTFSITYPFECGLVDIFRRLCIRSSGTFVDKNEICTFVRNEFSFWAKHNKIINTKTQDIFNEVIEKAMQSENETYNLINYLAKDESDGVWITGLILGYAVFKKDSTLNNQSPWHKDMTQEYYKFTPQSFFENFKISSDNIIEVLSQFVTFSLKSQYEFSLERMQLGQLAKFLTLPDDHSDGFEMKGIDQNIYIQEGLLGLFDSVISLWRSADLLKSNSEGFLTPNLPKWLP